MSVLGRIGQVVRAEVSSLWRHEGTSDSTTTPPTKTQTTSPTTRGAAAGSVRAPTVTDVDGALRVLEFTTTPTLDDVRSRYRELARRYHPKTRSDVADVAEAAHALLEALTEALELLEEHLLPVAPVPPSTPPTIVNDPR